MIRRLAIANALALLIVAAVAYAQGVSADLEYDVDIFADPTDALDAEPPSTERMEEIAYPPAPVLPEVARAPTPLPSPQPSARPAVRAPGAEPRLSPCVTPEEAERAHRGTGCDCSCQGYARLPALAPGEQRRCMIACGLAYHRCWSPPPTDSEIADYVSRQDWAAAPYLRDLPDLRERVSSTIMLERAISWEERQMCTP
jgi:hypothetical protein